MGIKRLYDFFQSVLMPFSFITAQMRRKTCSVEMAGLLWESLYRQEELARRRAPDEAQPAVPMGDLVYERFRRSVKHRLNEIFAVFKDTGSVLVFEGNYIYKKEPRNGLKSARLPSIRPFQLLYFKWGFY